jgi:phosphatidylglycerophosphate synthase
MNVPGFPFEPVLILRLRHTLQKTKSEEEFWAWHFARRLSIYLTLVLAKTAITPNQVTVVGIWSGVVGGILWGAGTHQSFLLGCVCLQMMYLLDCVDGELARIKNLQSPKGAYLDLLGHYLVDYCMIMGMGIGLSRAFGNLCIYLAVGLVIVYLGDELLRDLLLKARIKSGKSNELEVLHKTFSLSHSFGSITRAFGAMVVGSPGFFTGMLFFSAIDAILEMHYWKLGFFLVWAAANSVKFITRRRRIFRGAFQESSAV